MMGHGVLQLGHFHHSSASRSENFVQTILLDERLNLFHRTLRAFRYISSFSSTRSDTI